MPLRNSLATLVGLTLAAAVLVLAPASPVVAQEQEEAIAYTAWFGANQTQDNAKAVEAAEAYLEQFPTGQYAEFLKKWLVGAQHTRLNDAIKAGDVAKMLEVGEVILATDPENLNILHALAFQLRGRELLASPRSYAHATEAVKYSQKAIGLVESGKTLAGVQDFDKNGTLAALYQVLAIVKGREGSSAAAVELYEKSISLAPSDRLIVGRNLFQLVNWRQASYTEAVKAYNAFPDEARGAAEPSDEVRAARETLDEEADGFIDTAARFVAFAETANLPKATRDRMYAILEGVYKSRNPDDAEAAGLQAVIDAKK